tara:strand:+ start:739 stop:1089 length:351 start_codon:yes stop_codon:yes gene_type:complete
MIIKTFLSFLSIIFSLLMIYITFINYKRNVLKKFELLIWNLVWIGIIFISIRPNSVDQYFSKNYDIDIFYIITILSIISLVIFNYFNMLKIKILEKKIDTIIRAESLKEIIGKIKD